MLQAGVSLVDISPEKGIQLAGYPHCPRPNKGIHDPLYASSLILDNGEKKIAIVTMDLLYIGKKCFPRFSVPMSAAAAQNAASAETGE